MVKLGLSHKYGCWYETLTGEVGMLGINNLTISGNVGQDALFGETSRGLEACSFMLAINEQGPEGGDLVTWIRVNAYGTLVAIVRDKVRKGGYVIVRGEMMNRKTPDRMLVEVRARSIIVVKVAEKICYDSPDKREDLLSKTAEMVESK